MKRLLAWLFGWPLVWTRDYDGEVRLRKARWTPWGYIVYGIVSSTVGTLKQDGTIEETKRCYMAQWKPANKRAEHLFD